MNWYAVKEGMRVPVRFCHYWEGREFSTECPLPAWLVRLFSKRKYGTHARVTVDDHCEVVSYTVCAPSDMPQRSEGRWWALLKLELTLCRLGWTLWREDGKSMYEVELERMLEEEAKNEAARLATERNRAEGLARQPAIRAARAAARARLAEEEGAPNA